MAVEIHGQLNKGASWGPAAQVARPVWGCGGLRVAAPIMWGAPAPACGLGSWRRCRKCVVIDSRTFKYPPCNKNRLPALPARQRLALCWRGAAEPGRAEPSGAGTAVARAPPPAAAGPPGCPENRDGTGALHLAGAAGRRNKAVRRGGLPGGERCRAVARRRSGRARLSSLALGACSR